MKTQYSQVAAYTTKDGSEIRELIHPDKNLSKNQSLAEATVAVGATTLTHCHHLTEEIYHITQGTGRMRLGTQSFEVSAGDSACIAPGTPHNIANIGDVPLKILCCCAPPYSHGDTELLQKDHKS